jgi:hypothetical protein
LLPEELGDHCPPSHPLFENPRRSRAFH